MAGTRSAGLGTHCLTDLLDHLNALRAFEAVARLGSVRDAAAEMSVTDGAVSKQLRNLEAALGTELFIRGHRKLIPTDDAKRFADTLGAAFESIVRVGQSVQRVSGTATLNIAAPGTFIVRWLLPRLPQLEAKVKGVEINLVTWNKFIETTDRSIDLHVVVGKPYDIPGMTREQLGLETFGPVAAPTQLRANAKPLDILKLRRLTTAWPTAMWRNWAAESGHTLADAPVSRFERLLFSIEAAEAGMGATLAPGPSVWDAIVAGKLVAPLGLHVRDGIWSMVWRTDQTSGLYMSVLRWFQKEFQASEAAALAAM